jgi:CxxC-x17-CxxC domain-containing protein
MADMIELQDKALVCKDCAKEFIFTAGEQEFFVTKKFHTPTRCKECRMKRKNTNTSSSINPHRQLYEITCAKCGKKDKVPFKPIEGRPLYCKSCYEGIKQGVGNIR